MSENSMFPNNSILKRQEEKKRLEPVVSEPVQLRKKGFFTRFKEAIFVDDSGSIGGYIIRDIIIPAIRDTMYDTVTGALSMALYSTPKASKSKKNSGAGTYISYADYYNDTRSPARRIQTADRYRTKFDIRNVPVPSYKEGMDVIEGLRTRMMAYDGECSVQDLFDLLDIGSVPSTMAKQGWTDISTADVENIRGEWILRMPPIKQL